MYRNYKSTNPVFMNFKGLQSVFFVKIKSYNGTFLHILISIENSTSKKNIKKNFLLEKIVDSFKKVGGTIWWADHKSDKAAMNNYIGTLEFLISVGP